MSVIFNPLNHLPLPCPWFSRFPMKNTLHDLVKVSNLKSICFDSLDYLDFSNLKSICFDHRLTRLPWFFQISSQSVLTHSITLIFPTSFLHCIVRMETTNEMIQIKRCACLCVFVGSENWTNPEGSTLYHFLFTVIITASYIPFIIKLNLWCNIICARHLVVKEWWLQNTDSHCIVT